MKKGTKQPEATPDLPPDEAENAWREMPFVDEAGKWAPAKVEDRYGGAEWAVGMYYAASLIGYLQQQHDYDSGYTLRDLMVQIVGRKLGFIVDGLLLGLGQYIATGSIHCAVDFCLVPYEVGEKMKCQAVIAPEPPPTG